MKELYFFLTLILNNIRLGYRKDTVREKRKPHLGIGRNTMRALDFFLWNWTSDQSHITYKFITYTHHLTSTIHVLSTLQILCQMVYVCFIHTHTRAKVIPLNLYISPVK